MLLLRFIQIQKSLNMLRHGWTQKLYHLKSTDMSSQASIDISLLRPCSPREVLVELIDSGWSIDFEGEVLFLLSSDVDSYDWQKEHIEKFNLEAFLNSHPLSGKIGIAMVFDGKFGGEFLIHRDWISLSISINRICLFEAVPDFNKYIGKLRRVIDGFGVSSFSCEYIA